jgi:hypothetical protein
VYLEGRDVSHWQQTTPSLSGMAFLWAKASEGNFLDDMYVAHVNAALSHSHVDPFAYHFGRAEWTPQVQVQTFLDQTQRALLLALDVEHATSGTTMSETQGRDFIRLLRLQDPLKRRIGLYGSLRNPWSTWPADNWGADFAWKAWPGSSAPPSPWAFWQFHQTGGDLDYFNGDRAALDALIGRPPAATGVDAMINRSGYPKNYAAAKDLPFYEHAGDDLTKPLARMSKAAVVAVQGRVVSPGGGWYLVWLNSSAGYADDVLRPSGYYLHLQEPVTWAP